MHANLNFTGAFHDYSVVFVSYAYEMLEKCLQNYLFAQPLQEVAL